MISTRKRQLAITLILACICIPALATEPNEAKTELKFEISTKETKWMRDKTQPGRGPIKPAYVATLFIKDDYYFSDLPNSEEIEVLVKTYAGESMSVPQKELLAKSEVVAARIGHEETVKDHFYYRLYAVSPDDAKKMAEALIEALNDQHTRMRLYKLRLHNLQEELSHNRMRLVFQDIDMEIDLTRFREAMKNVHYLTVEEAKITISELNKMLNHLDIDRAGVQAKIKAIREHQSRQKAIRDKKLEEGISREGILLKLEEMLVDLFIEFDVLEDRMETASRLRGQAEHFYKQMNDKQLDLQRRANYVRINIEENEQELRRIERILTNPESDMLPPRVYQNKVTIYPVRVDNK